MVSSNKNRRRKPLFIFNNSVKRKSLDQLESTWTCKMIHIIDKSNHMAQHVATFSLYFASSNQKRIYETHFILNMKLTPLWNTCKSSSSMYVKLQWSIHVQWLAERNRLNWNIKTVSIINLHSIFKGHRLHMNVLHKHEKALQRSVSHAHLRYSAVNTTFLL